MAVKADRILAISGFKDLSVVRYATRIEGTLSRGKGEVSGTEGVKATVLVWVKVTGVAVESYKSDKTLVHC